MGCSLWPCLGRSTKRISAGEKVRDGLPGKEATCTKAGSQGRACLKRLQNSEKHFYVEAGAAHGSR